MKSFNSLSVGLLLGFAIFTDLRAQTNWQGEWEKTLAAAKKEGKVVVGIPPSTELRKALESTFKAKFGFELELFPATGPQIANRVVTEGKAGVRYFDTFIFGSCTGCAVDQDWTVRSSGKLHDSSRGERSETLVGRPRLHGQRERHAAFLFFHRDQEHRRLTGTTLRWPRPEELRSLDNFLDPKWKSKIGLSDPRVAGSGLSVWSYLWDVKGEDYLKKLVQQDLFVTQNLRQLAEALAKGKVALTLGIGIAQTEPFVKAGLPLKSLPEPREGSPSSNGYGSLAILKNPPHPNATKSFCELVLSKEGQEIYSRALLHGTRRLDVDTKWMAKRGRGSI